MPGLHDHFNLFINLQSTSILVNVLFLTERVAMNDDQDI